MGKHRRPLAAAAALPVECELRLAGRPDALEAAFESRLTASGDGRPDKTKVLENRYFDTASHRLRSRGLAFRVRKDGDEHRQTLKAGDDAHGVLLARGEWETPLGDDQPKPAALPKKAAKLLAEALLDDELEEVFRTSVTRRTRHLAINGDGSQLGEVEAALDIGEIDTVKGAEPIAEIELELVDGAPDALYQLALALHEAGSLRLETRSKSSRAYHRLAEQSPPWHKGTLPALKPSTSIDDAMAAIFRACFEHWLANQAAALDGGDPEGVHQLRVGLRRLRSALTVFRELIPDDQLVWLQPGAKQAINSLGPARDWDVFMADLLAPVIAARPDDRALLTLRRKARIRLRASYRQARTSLEGADYTRFALRFGHWLESRGWQAGRDPKAAERGAMPIAALASRVLKKRHNRALILGDGFADLSVEARHQLRIALKKLRYATEFFGPLFDKRGTKPYVRTLKGLQDDLGHLNDVAVAETLLAELLAKPGKRDDPAELGRAAGLVIGWHARGVADLEGALIGDWAGFAECPRFWA